MKITVSYINSKFDLETTIKKIEACESADAIHMDLMDGKYVASSNFAIEQIQKDFKNVTKKIDVHLMTMEPEKYLNVLLKLNTNIIFFHPSTCYDPISFIEEVKRHNKKVGIVINPDEDIKSFSEFFPLIDVVLLMSVTPGKGGQHFLRESLVNYELIKEEKKKYLFEIYVDGGINDETIKFIPEADGIISGSFICNSDDFDEQINKLVSNINHC